VLLNCIYLLQIILLPCYLILVCVPFCGLSTLGFFYLIIDNIQVVFWYVVHYVTFSFWFILNFYHVSASYVSLTVKNRQVYCAFENTIGDLFLNMFSSSSYILYILYIAICIYNIYIIHHTKYAKFTSK